MIPEFQRMQKHNDSPRRVPESGKVVLSQLSAGTSLVGAPAPSLKLVLDGQEDYEVDGRVYRVEPGQFLYLDAGVDCYARLSRPAMGLCLLMPPSTIAAACEPLMPRALVLPVQTSAVGQTLNAHARRIAGHPEHGERLAPDLMGSVRNQLDDLISDVSLAIDCLKSVKASTRTSIYQRLEAARAFLHDHVDRAVPLSELSALVGISQFHFARFFKAAFGATPIAYHRRLRMMKAAEILRRGDRSINEVAEAVGYGTQIGFTHAFSRHFGFPPGRWARRAGR